MRRCCTGMRRVAFQGSRQKVHPESHPPWASRDKYMLQEWTCICCRMTAQPMLFLSDQNHRTVALTSYSFGTVIFLATLKNQRKHFHICFEIWRIMVSLKETELSLLTFSTVMFWKKLLFPFFYPPNWVHVVTNCIVNVKYRNYRK